MGLDSVELLMTIEKTFRIAIPDDVSVQMDTSRKVIDFVARVRGLETGVSGWEQTTQSALADAIRDLRGLSRQPSAEDDISSFFETPPVLTAAYLADRLDVSVPRLPAPARTKAGAMFTKLVGMLLPADGFPLRLRTLNDAINARNLVVDKGVPALQTSYEAYLVLMCILEHQMGLDLLEMDPDKSFTRDYGID